MVKPHPLSCPLSKSSCGCMPTFKSVPPKVCLTKVPFVAIFWPDRNTKIDVVIYMYSKHSPDYISSKCIWVHGSNSQGSSVFVEIPFLAFLALHRERKRCNQVGPSTCYSQSEVIYAYQSFISVGPRVFLVKISFLASFFYHGNYFPDFLAHILSWVKTYYHASFREIHLPVWLQ